MLRAAAATLFITFLLLFFYSNYEAHLSSDAQRGKKNLEHLTAVKPGMDTAQVLRIMGQPAWRSRFKKPQQETVFGYTVPAGSSADCQVVFDAQMHVR